MSVNNPQYPNSVYDGLGPARVDRERDAAPDHIDWDQMIAELIAVQKELNVTKQLSKDEREFSAVNSEGTALVVGNTVYMKTDGTIAKADVDGAAALRIPVGLCKTGGANGISIDVQFSGKFTLTTAEWDAVAGTTGGLTIGAKYFAADTPGIMAEAAPPTAADTLFVMGVAISATTMLVRLDDEGLKV